MSDVLGTVVFEPLEIFLPLAFTKKPEALDGRERCNPDSLSVTDTSSKGPEASSPSSGGRSRILRHATSASSTSLLSRARTWAQTPSAVRQMPPYSAKTESMGEPGRPDSGLHRQKTRVEEDRNPKWKEWDRRGFDAFPRTHPPLRTPPDQETSLFLKPSPGAEGGQRARGKGESDSERTLSFEARRGPSRAQAQTWRIGIIMRPRPPEVSGRHPSCCRAHKLYTDRFTSSLHAKGQRVSLAIACNAIMLTCCPFAPSPSPRRAYRRYCFSV